MIEFTGERIVPGQVDADLLNEHTARYAFASRLAHGTRALDAGCGSGYGSSELARVARFVVGADIAAEAVAFARQSHGGANLLFEQASCTALPHPAGAFDFVTAFEVIEHLENWRALLAEGRRLLAPGGLFLVSTPNRLVYTESRGPAGSNPFHIHEFEFDEFRAELAAVFPSVALFLENHAGAILFQSLDARAPVETLLESTEPNPKSAHYFLAVCSLGAQTAPGGFVYVPRAANVLLERERHIGLLQNQLAEIEAERGRLAGLLETLQAELERSNRWAEELNLELAERRARVTALQDEVLRSNGWASELNAEVAERRARVTALQDEVIRSNAWAQQVDTEIVERRERVEQLQKEVLDRNRWAEDLNAEIAERRARIVELQEEVTACSRWAQDLVQEIEENRAAHDVTRGELDAARKDVERLHEESERRQEELEGLRATIRSSRWVKLGRRFGLGPAL